MADQDNSDVLNRIVVRVYRSLLQYTLECWPWTAAYDSPDAKSDEQKAIEQMATRQQAFIARLVDLLMQRGATVDFGNYPDLSELHYVSLDYLLGKLIAGEQQVVPYLESTLPALKGDATGAGLVAELLAAEKENLTRLRDLAAKAAKSVPA